MQELDSEIISAVQNKSKDAFRQLYDFYSPFIWKVLYQMMNGDKAEVQHVMQDTFVKAFLSIKSFRFDSAFSTWLYRIAYTSGLNHIRGRKRWRWRMREIDDNSAAANSNGSELDSSDLTKKVLTSLTPQDRFLITAREVDGVTYEELEKMTGNTAGSLRTKISRIKESLRKDFENELR
jgi:RNA polymerase sigma-70 factor (ECF subfamily)